MVTSAPVTPDAGRAVDRGRGTRWQTGRLAALLIPFLVSLLANGWCYRATGPTLGLFFGGILLVAIITPPLVLGEPASRPRRSALAGAGVVLGTMVVWGWSVRDPAIRLSDCGPPTAVLLAWVACLSGMALLLRRMRLPPALASFLVTLIALVWLAWPVWLSPWIAGRETLVKWLSLPHPLLCINADLTHLGLWDEQRYAYTLTALVRDVAYIPPPGVRWAVTMHGLLAGAAWTLSLLRRRTSVHSTVPEDEPSQPET